MTDPPKGTSGSERLPTWRPLLACAAGLVVPLGTWLLFKATQDVTDAAADRAAAAGAVVGLIAGLVVWIAVRNLPHDRPPPTWGPALVWPITGASLVLLALAPVVALFVVVAGGVLGAVIAGLYAVRLVREQRDHD
jgi:Na+/proline symporter